MLLGKTNVLTSNPVYELQNALGGWRAPPL
ncbi:MAG: hypothetical protein M3511_09010 [Deinococcota bacterium]|nr:hypothetical protein [Deinococcota bacterium]